jgi:plastocyanin
MNRRNFLAGVTALSTPLIVGCSDTGNGGADGGDEDVADETVTIADQSFDPVRLDIDAGTAVEWVNESETEHTVTSAKFHEGAQSWDLDIDVEAGGNAVHSFDVEGIHEYHCSVHGAQSMCGIVLVGDASLDDDMPCE